MKGMHLNTVDALERGVARKSYHCASLKKYTARFGMFFLLEECLPPMTRKRACRALDVRSRHIFFAQSSSSGYSSRRILRASSCWRQCSSHTNRIAASSIYLWWLLPTLPCPCTLSSAVAAKSRSILTRLLLASVSFAMVWIQRCVCVVFGEFHCIFVVGGKNCDETPCVSVVCWNESMHLNAYSTLHV
jgi:hypothetical protein